MKRVLFVIFGLFGALAYLYKDGHWRDSTEATRSFDHNQAGLIGAPVVRPNTSRSVISSDPIDLLNPIDSDEVFPGRGGVAYRSIDEIDKDPIWVAQLKSDLENFQQYGSIGRGRTTVEFHRTEELKESLSRKGVNSLLDGLAFNPVHLVNVVEPGFVMIGADDQGKLIPSRGWSGFLQAFEEKATGRQIELSELQMETLLGDETEVVREFLNAKVGDSPATIQTMKDGGGNDVYAVQWDDGDRSFSLHTQSFGKEDALGLASVVRERYRMLPHKGWKTPYVLDPHNPLHRMALQRDQQRTHSEPKK